MPPSLMLVSVMPVVCCPWHSPDPDPDAAVLGAAASRPPQAAKATSKVAVTAVQPIADTRISYSFRRIFVIERVMRPASPARPVGATYITAMINKPKMTPGAASLTS